MGKREIIMCAAYSSRRYRRCSLSKTKPNQTQILQWGVVLKIMRAKENYHRTERNREGKQSRGRCVTEKQQAKNFSYLVPD